MQEGEALGEDQTFEVDEPVPAVPWAVFDRPSNGKEGKETLERASDSLLRL
jgi:hypothetical protein